MEKYPCHECRDDNPDWVLPFPELLPNAVMHWCTGESDWVWTIDGEERFVTTRLLTDLAYNVRKEKERRNYGA